MALRILTAGILWMSLLIISGCTQLPTKPVSSVISKPPVAQQSAWKQRQVSLTRKNTWKLRSKASLRYGDENQIFGLNWSQFPNQNYQIQINNPITGAVVSKLNRSKGVVSLLADNGRIYRDSDEERLLKNQSGLTIPVKGMQYWVRGLTSPQYKIDSLVLDNAGRPRSLQQAGWKINYSSYVNNEINALPRKINLNRGAEKIYIRLVAKNWQ